MREKLNKSKKMKPGNKDEEKTAPKKPYVLSSGHLKNTKSGVQLGSENPGSFWLSIAKCCQFLPNKHFIMIKKVTIQLEI